MSNKKQQTFNRSDIELALSQEFPNLSKSQISLAIDSILESIVDAVALDEKVEIRGFGTFSKKYIRPRKFINPKTKEVSYFCLLYTSPSPRDRTRSRMPSSA